MLNKIYAAIGGIVALFTVLAMIFQKGKLAGKKVEQDKQKDETLEVVRNAKDIENSVMRMPDADVRDELRQYYRD